MQIKKNYRPWLVLWTAVILSSPVQAQLRAKTYKKIPLLQLQDTAFRCTIIGKEVYLDGDIYLGDTTALNRLQQLAFGLAIDDSWLLQTRWKNSLVPVLVDNNFQVSEKNSIIEGLNEIMAATNIAFKLRSTETDYIFYKKVSEEELGFKGGRSPVGRQGNMQEIRISAMSKNVAKHETLHSLGFFHEQSRPDRDDFVTIQTKNIQKGAEGNFDKHIFFVKPIGGYDFMSIMHYGARDFGIPDNDNFPKQTIKKKSNPDDTIMRGEDLSRRDIAAVNTIYPLRGSPRTPLPVFTDLYGDNEAWTDEAYYGSKGTYLADVTGDGRADAIVVNDGGITVRRSQNGAFASNESWTGSAFFGEKSTHFADVTGDGKADCIAVNLMGISVAISTGNAFAPAITWYNGQISDTKGAYFADVTGDGKADAISVSSTGIQVHRSTGVGFAAPGSWTNSAYFGTRGIYFADVTGDRKADAIVVNDGGVTVRRSNGTSFTDNETWTNNPYYGNRGNYFADVTGDGKADAIVVNNDGVTVRRAGTNSFLTNETGTGNPYYSERLMLFADLNGDRKADAIVINNANVVAKRAR